MFLAIPTLYTSSLEATLIADASRARTKVAVPESHGPPIVYLLSQYPALTHTYLLREVLELRKLGLNIHVVSIRPSDRPVDTLEGAERDEAVPTFYVKLGGFWKTLATHAKFMARHPFSWIRGLNYTLHLSRRNPGKLLNHLFYFVEAIVVGCWMQNKRSSHVHTHFVSTVAVILKKVFPITFSMTIHGPEEFDDAIGFHLDEKMATADFVFSISYYSQSQLMRASSSENWHKIQVVPLGVNPLAYRPAPRPAETGTFRLFCVARLAPVKAQTILLQSVASLIKAGRRIELHLVGGGSDRERLEHIAGELGIRSAVVFHGGLPHPRVIELLGTAHAFALASFAEGVPVALMEAMALEIPCIATCVMGIPELIRDRIDGLLVPPSDIRALSAAIEELIDHPELRARFGQSGRRHVMEKYDVERNVRTMADIFRERIN